MHVLKYSPKTTKDSKSHSFAPMENGIAVMHENDLKNNVIKLRGYCYSLILIPRTFSLKENPDIELLLKFSLTPDGQIKYY